MERFELTPKKKFDLFFYSLILIAFILDFYVVKASFGFFSYTLIFGIAIMLNDKKFYEVKDIRAWEFLLGLLIIISSFTVVTPIKWHFVPGTSTFGVFNGGILIIGYFISFYGLRKYNVVFPFLIFYGAIVTLNGTWWFFMGKFAEYYLAPLSSHLAYSLLVFFGYPASISETTITIISKSGQIISATVAGACSGIEGMTLSAIMLTGLLMGTKMRYLWRAIIIILAVGIMFILNVIRLTLIFIFAYFYSQVGLEESHQWLGNLIFLGFILVYWFIISKWCLNNAYFLIGGEN